MMLIYEIIVCIAAIIIGIKQRNITIIFRIIGALIIGYILSCAIDFVAGSLFSFIFPCKGFLNALFKASLLSTVGAPLFYWVGGGLGFLMGKITEGNKIAAFVPIPFFVLHFVKDSIYWFSMPVNYDFWNITLVLLFRCLVAEVYVVLTILAFTKKQ
ncbi:hypothetical protein AGMMS50239_09930 [Bacteroidia bacterium]|nr:hypothetical protein AGMMS50239_09930 [Bacteroidia bacterium]